MPLQVLIDELASVAREICPLKHESVDVLDFRAREEPIFNIAARIKYGDLYGCD
jgi:hypothetical protein